MDPIVQTLTIPALQIRAGDIFTRHRREHVAADDAHHHGQFTVIVGIEGGEIYFSVRDTVTVTREVRRRSTWSATA